MGPAQIVSIFHRPPSRTPGAPCDSCDNFLGYSSSDPKLDAWKETHFIVFNIQKDMGLLLKKRNILHHGQ